MLSSRWWRLVALLVLVIGAALRIAEYVDDPPLNVDEAALARNVVARGWTELFAPLDFAQVAPPAALALMKVIVGTAGDGERALRLPSLVVSIATLPLLLVVARGLLPWPLAALVVALAAFSPPLIAHSVSAKTYAFDVASSVGIVAIMIAARRTSSTPAAMMCALVAVIVAQCSFTAVFGLSALAWASAGLAWTADASEDRRQWMTVAIGAATGVLSAVAVSRSVTSETDLAYLRFFWVSGFPPQSAAGPATAAWLVRRTTDLFSQTLQYRAAWFWVLLSSAGVVALFRKSKSEGIVVTAPLVLTIGAAALGLYPFAPGRVTLFLEPYLFLLAATGAAAVGQWRFGRALSMASVGLMLALSANAAVRPERGGIRRTPIREFLAAARASWQPGDHLFVHYAEAQPMSYYATRLGFSAADYTVGSCSTGSWETYTRELSNVRDARRVWLAVDRRPDDEYRMFAEFFSAMGATAVPTAIASYGFLFEMPPASRWGSRPFVIPEPYRRDQPYRWSCYGVFGPSTPADDGSAPIAR